MLTVTILLAWATPLLALSKAPEVTRFAAINAEQLKGADLANDQAIASVNADFIAILNYSPSAGVDEVLQGLNFNLNPLPKHKSMLASKATLHRGRVGLRYTTDKGRDVLLGAECGEYHGLTETAIEAAAWANMKLKRRGSDPDYVFFFVQNETADPHISYPPYMERIRQTDVESPVRGGGAEAAYSIPFVDFEFPLPQHCIRTSASVTKRGVRRYIWYIVGILGLLSAILATVIVVQCRRNSSPSSS